MKRGIILIVCFIICGVFVASIASTGEANPEIVEVVESKLKEKMLQSGTLDIYDSDTEKVRNLRLMEISENIIEREGDC